MQLIGLDKYINLINSFTLDLMPRALMILGASGSGKHLLCNLISNKLNLPVEYVSNSVDLDFIEYTQSVVNPTIFVINGDTITLKEEAVLLKSIEEPGKNCYFIIIGTTELMSTINNRCIIWNLPIYTKQQLSLFTSDEFVLSIANTPGDILKLQAYNLNELIDVCDKLIDKVNIANYSNTLSIANRLAYSDEDDKFDIYIFIRALISRLKLKILNDNNAMYVNMFNVVSDTEVNLYIKNIDERLLIEKCLTDLWLTSRGMNENRRF